MAQPSSTERASLGIQRAKRRAAAVAAMMLACVISLTIGWQLAVRSAAPDAGPTVDSFVPSRISAPVQDSALVAEVVARARFTTPGTHEVSLAKPPTLGESGVAIITGLLELGTLVATANTIVEISGLRVVALQGSIPLLRDLSIGDRGPDVAALENALIAAKLLDAGHRDNVISAAELAAVSQMLGGLPAPAPAVVADIAQLQSQRDQLVAAITDLDVQIRSAEAPGSAAEVEQAAAEIELLEVSQARSRADALAARVALQTAISGISAALESNQAELDDLTEQHDRKVEELALQDREDAARQALDRLALDAARADLDRINDPPHATELRTQRSQQAQALADLDAQVSAAIAALVGVIPASQIIMVDELPAALTRVEYSIGDPFLGGALLELQSKQPQLIVSLDEASVRFIEVGVIAEILDDSLAPTTASATVTDIVSDGTESRLELSVDNPDELDLADNVAVRFDLRARSDTALTVPSAALSVDSNGRTFVIVLRDGADSRVFVVPGLVTSEGLVAVEVVQGELAAGDQVVVGLARSNS